MQNELKMNATEAIGALRYAKACGVGVDYRISTLAKPASRRLDIDEYAPVDGDILVIEIAPETLATLLDAVSVYDAKFAIDESYSEQSAFDVDCGDTVRSPLINGAYKPSLAAD